MTEFQKRLEANIRESLRFAVGEVDEEAVAHMVAGVNAVLKHPGAPAPLSDMTGWVYDSDHPMSDGHDTRMTAAEEVLAYLLIEVNGSPDDVPYSPNEAQRILEDRLREGRRLETDYAEFLAHRRAALATTEGSDNG